MARNWTEEQRQAIEARGGTLLISAAAGSGKTAVLVERVIRRITGESPCDVDRLLVVTFTNAAAAEMKERISLRLEDLAAEHPSDRNLKRQQVLLQNAHISTIHSFCLDLLREYFEQLNIPPDFRIADENEGKILRRDVLAELLEERYAARVQAGGEGDFAALAEMLGAGRDDAQLEDTVLRLYDFVRSLPDPEDWLDDKLRMYDPQIPVADSLWGRAALRYAETALRGAVGVLKSALETIGGYEPLQIAYGDAFGSDLKQVRTALNAAKARDWDALYNTVAGFEFIRLSSLRKFEREDVRDAVKAQRDEVKAVVDRLRKTVLCCNSAVYTQDLKAVYPLAVALFDLVTAFDARLFEQKLKRNILDYDDLEQLALRLLTDRSPDGGTKPSAAARTISRRFEEVLVDEYQDVNQIQDAIFRAVSDNGSNLFMVGDVKQSIYRFRKATPELFIEKKDRFAPFDRLTYPAKIILGRNFRSRSGVTGAVNFLFRQLMSREFGEIDYGAEEELIPAAAYPAHEETEFALHIVDTSGYDDNDGKEELEARHIAGLIRSMIDRRATVQGEDGPRPVTYRDFCILLRSTTGRAEKYQRELTAAGIPAYADVSGGYLGSYEVAVMLSLLRVLDNPLQDVPLLSVMLSPVFGFSPDDLARIRIDNRRGSLYLALVAFAKREGGRYADFLSQLDSLRRLAAVLPADRLMLRIYEQTGFLNIFQAMPAGEARRANLRLLLEYARSYETAGYKGLAGFLRFIDRVGGEEGDLSPASAVSESADVVRIMSIHKSKGLEFPVCILAGCAKRFNREDTQRPALFHPVYGFGSIVRDQSLNCRFTTLAREVVKLQTERSALSEEMRVLYVAMTRAREKLVCVMTLPNPSSTAKKALTFLRPGERRLDPLNASQAQNFAEWLIACMLRHPRGQELRRLAGAEHLEVLDDDVPFEAVVAPAQSAGVRNEPQTIEKNEVPELPDDIRSRLSFTYPRAQMTRVPSKFAVSELAEKPMRELFAPQNARPAFLAGSGLTPAQAGTALHAFLQYARFSQLRDEREVETEIERLTAAHFLLPEEASAISREKILTFLKSAIFERILHARSIYKELRFNIEENAGMLMGSEAQGGNTVVLQGMADIVFEEDDGFYILDYKTDRVDAETLRERYSRQLQIYAKAVCAIMKKPVRSCYIYGFHKGVTVEVESPALTPNSLLQDIFL